jgi:hypothetical protein
MKAGKTLEIREQEEAGVNKERIAFMRTLMTFGFLLIAIILFPGCYTILLVEPTDEDVSFNPVPPIPDPGPLPTPAPPPDPGPHPPRPPHPHPTPSPVIVIINPPSTPPSPDIHRPIRTDRGPFVSNPAPPKNDKNNRRESGIQRDGQTVSNPAPVRNDDNNNGTRESGVQRGRR